MLKKEYVPLFLLLAALLLSGLPAPMSTGEKENTRATDLVVSSGKTVINSPAVYRNIIVNGTGRLEINGAVVSVEEKFIVNSVESTLEIIQGTLTVTGGVFNVRAKYVKIREESSIYVKNTTSPGDGENGGPAYIYINTSGESSGRGLFIRDSTVKVEGEKGGDGTSSGTMGGRGGAASIYLASTAGTIEIMNSKILVMGGDGGDAGSAVSAQGGKGGDVELKIYTNRDLIVDSSEINATGGDGGEPSGNTRGGRGGLVSDYTLLSNGYMNVSASDIVSLGGVTKESLPYSRENSRVYLISGKKVIFDKEKPVDKKDQVLSHIKTEDITIRAVEGAELHEVDTGESSPLTDITECTIYLYWYLTIHVTDNFGAPIPSARIRIYRGPDEVFPGEEFFTDQNGVWSGELPSKIVNIDPNSNVFIHYNVKAEVTGGAVGTYPDVSLKGNTTITVMVRLIDLTVTKIMGKTPGEGMVVGGDVVIEGTAKVPPGVTSRRVVQVYVQIDNGELNLAEDLTGDWSRWRYLWDTLLYEDGEHLIQVYASDGTYTVVWKLTVVVNQGSVNHPPRILQVSLKDGSKIVKYKEDPTVRFWVLVGDMDATSTIPSGRDVTEVEINFVYVATGETVYTAVVPATSLEVGKWNITVDWNTFERDELKREIFPAGNYTLIIRAKDDAQAWSRPMELNLYLVKYVRPTAIISFVNKIPPQYDKVQDTLYVTLTVKEKHSIEVLFNASGSYDEDGVYYLKGDKRYYYKDLIFVWNFGDGTGIERKEETPEVKHVYNFKESQTFTVNLTVIDADGLEDTIHFQVRIEYIPPPKPPVGPLSDIAGVSVPLGKNAFLGTIALLIIFGALLGIWYFYTEKLLPKWMEKGAEKDIKEVTKMHEELRKKQAEAIEEEFTKGKPIITAAAEEEAAEKKEEAAPKEAGPVKLQRRVRAAPRKEEEETEKKTEVVEEKPVEKKEEGKEAPSTPAPPPPPPPPPA